MKNKDVMRKLLIMPQSESEHSAFTFKTFVAVGNCGTMGCLAGDLPGISKEWVFAQDLKNWTNGPNYPMLKETEGSVEYDLIKFFGLPIPVINLIFYQSPYGLINPSREQAQAHGIKVLKENGIDIFED